MKKQILLFFLLPLFCAGQVPNLLKDITPGAASSTLGPFSLLPNNEAIFCVSSPSANVGLWTSDGSVVGTKFLKGILGNQFTDYAGEKFFVTNHAGYPLWKTDGTLAGTDSIPVPGLTAIASLTVWNNLLIFAGTHTASGTELWRSDGSLAGTYMLKDIWSGAANGVLQSPTWVSANGYCFFVANDGINGAELWRTDGSTAGTVLLKDINPGSAASNITNIWSGNNGVYFVADDGTNGLELWFSDGTTANTILLVNQGAGSLSGIPDFPPLFLGNSAYFSYASRVLYKSDGTVANTTSVALFPALTNSITPILMRPGIQEHNGQLYYLLANQFYSPIPPILGYTDTIYFYRLTPMLGSQTLLEKTYYSRAMNSQMPITYAVPFRTGPHLMYVLASGIKGHLFVYNVAQNTSHKFYNSHNNMFNNDLPTKTQVFSNKAYLPAYGTGNGFEPCYVDLLTDSLVKLKPGANLLLQCPFSWGMVWNHDIFELNGKYYFIAYSQSTGTEFYETDFTQAGTFILKDIYPGADSFFGPSVALSNCNSGKLNGLVTPHNIFFAGNDGSFGLELWSFINSPNPTGGSERAMEDSGMSIYPNPTKGKFRIQTGSAILKVQIMGVDGKWIQELSDKELGPNGEMDSPECAGLYLVRVQTAEKVYTQKLLVAP